MSEITQDPMVKVIDFKTTYERLPVHGDELQDTVDDRGFKLDVKGKRVMDMQEVDWVKYAPSHSPINTQNWERIKHLRVTEQMLASEETEKLRAMKARWSQIEPAYAAYKDGRKIPVSGTPLEAWPGCTKEKADVLRRYGIVTVEEVSTLAENQMDKIQLPGMRDMRKSAKLFLDNRGAAESAEREAERDNEIALLKDQLREQNERLSAAMDLLEEKTSPTDDVEALRAELDGKGIKYHHKAGADTLRALLQKEAA